MTNEEFVKELKEKISSAKYNMRTTDIYGDVMQFDQFLSEKNYLNIRGLYYFAMQHRELQGWQIENLIKQNKDVFKFLNEFISVMDDMVDEIRVHGALYGAMVYQNKQVIIKNLQSSKLK